MPFVSSGGCERIEFDDPVTDAHVIQMTSFPVMSMHFYYEHPSFTADSGTLIYRSMRSSDRRARWDLWAVNADGSDMRQVTDEDDADNFALSHSEPIVWYQRGTTLWRADLLTGERVEIGPGPVGIEPMAYYVGCASVDGNYYFGYGRHPENGQGVVVRYRTDGSEADVFAEDANLCHLHGSIGGHGVSWGGIDAEGCGVMYGAAYDGTDRRILPTADLSHFTWVGREKRYLGAGMWPHKIIHTRCEGEGDSTVIVEGSYFSHTGLSYDADWTIADTNWPNEGLMLVNLRMHQYALLCHPRNSGGHPQWTHAHPAMSPDGSMAVYTSDRTGIMQVYVVRISQALRERLATPQPGVAPGGRLPDVRC